MDNMFLLRVYIMVSLLLGVFVCLLENLTTCMLAHHTNVKSLGD